MDLRGSIEPPDEERCELCTSDDSLDGLAVRIGMRGVDFEVHERRSSSSASGLSRVASDARPGAA